MSTNCSLALFSSYRFVNTLRVSARFMRRRVLQRIQVIQQQKYESVHSGLHCGTRVFKKISTSEALDIKLAIFSPFLTLSSVMKSLMSTVVAPIFGIVVFNKWLRMPRPYHDLHVIMCMYVSLGAHLCHFVLQKICLLLFCRLLGDDSPSSDLL